REPSPGGDCRFVLALRRRGVDPDLHRRLPRPQQALRERRFHMADDEESTAVATEEPEEPSTPELEAGDPGPSGLALVHHAPEHTHPSPVKYVGIAVLLAVITALEVALYYIHMPAVLLVFFLLILACLKFSLVAAFF